VQHSVIVPQNRRCTRPKIFTALFFGPRQQYDMREIIARLVDGSAFEEYQAEPADGACGYARIDG
jgi:acetyl-CoA carboxylase carboxyltransferase component